MTDTFDTDSTDKEWATTFTHNLGFMPHIEIVKALNKKIDDLEAKLLEARASTPADTAAFYVFINAHDSLYHLLMAAQGDTAQQALTLVRLQAVIAARLEAIGYPVARPEWTQAMTLRLVELANVYAIAREEYLKDGAGTAKEDMYRAAMLDVMGAMTNYVRGIVEGDS